MMSSFLGIAREQVFSPGRVDDDRAILDLVATFLRQRGHGVSVINLPTSEWPEPAPGTIVFAMCQGAEALSRLEGWDARGVRVVNRPRAILNCQRHRTIARLAGSAVAFPESLLVETADRIEAPPWIARGAWLKRGDVHATESDDVVFLDSEAALHNAINRFRARGIQRAVLQAHVPGSVLKFYGVRGRFFHCVAPRTGVAPGNALLQRLERLGQTAAAALDVEIYGGDCVWDAGGGLTLIDLNDWPSYASCRTDAAQAIAAYLDATALTIRP
jgi:CheY-like chemotaxis protein